MLHHNSPVIAAGLSGLSICNFIAHLIFVAVFSAFHSLLTTTHARRKKGKYELRLRLRFELLKLLGETAVSGLRLNLNLIPQCLSS